MKKVILTLFVLLIIAGGRSYAADYDLNYNYTAGFLSVVSLSSRTAVEYAAQPMAGAELKNPAFADFNRHSLFFYGEKRGIGIPINRVSYGHPLGTGTFFVSIAQSSVKNLEYQRSTMPADFSHYTASFLLTATGYSTHISKFVLGGALKILYENIYQASAAGWALDIGIKHTLLKDLLVFAAVKNVGPSFSLQYAAYSLPLEFSGGTAYMNKYISASAEFRKKMGVPPEMILSGVVLKDFFVSPGFSLRAAFEDEPSVISYSGFAVFKYKNYDLRYELSVNKRFLNELRHSVSLSMVFGKERFRPYSFKLKKRVLAVMSAPDKQAMPLFFIFRNKTVYVIDKVNDGWYKVRNRFGKEGYARATRIR